ncbi:hypothetical protein JOQ06_028907 [Pogonophryne albipinna]|uniref:TatD DNase domain containing 3 n=1 Tax=Pogonophryne albipinna TaxID=1090488 RepID=A0AAD6BAZ8_9TELE|nr:hypothetical protein JOQ06_028907 [Pogonophryne albipinna]
MQGYVDCHCHISSKDFDKDLEEVVESSKQAGVLAILAVAEHAGEFEKIIELSQRFPGFIFPCLGVHPVQEVSPEQQRGASLQDLDAALPLIEKYKDQLVAIGEVGLDFTPRFVRGETDKDVQRKVLIRDLITLASINSQGKPHCLVSSNEFRLWCSFSGSACRRAAASGSSSRRQIHWLIAIVL